LRRVQDGERIDITDRGRPVAVLVPVPDDPLERLRASSDLQSAEADLADLPEPLHLAPGSESASEVLARRRRDER